MEIDQYLNKMKEIQQLLLKFIDDEQINVDLFTNLKQLFDNLKFQENPHLLKSLIYLISTVAANHHRTETFFPKIEKIIELIEKEIKQTYSNYEIYNFFRESKKILLFLLDKKIITIDEEILKQIKSVMSFKKYFYPEIKEPLNNFSIDDIEDFEKKRRIGENPDYIFELIRNDSIVDFIKYINHTNINLKDYFENSFFETNSFWDGKYLNLINYAAFYGSIQIFKYLQMQNVNLKPELWLCAIHSRSDEIINILNESHVKPPNNSYKQCFKEAIKCHHNDIAEYILNNYLTDGLKNLPKHCLKYHNFYFIEKEMINATIAFDLIEFDYYILFEYFLRNNLIDINMKYVYFYIF